MNRIDDRDLWLFNEGTHARLYEKLGAHPGVSPEGEAGTYFAVWLPGASRVSVIGTFNAWDVEAHPLQARGISGLWERFVPGAAPGDLYKFAAIDPDGSRRPDLPDPFASRRERPPGRASIVDEVDHVWGDASWMADRFKRGHRRTPLAIYEVPLDGWDREGRPPVPFDDLAARIVERVERRGFTHVEIDAPVDPSSPHAPFTVDPTRGGTGAFMALVDRLHRSGIGLIVAWSPPAVPFDGVGDREVRSWLASNAVYWIEAFHADGLRVRNLGAMLAASGPGAPPDGSSVQSVARITEAVHTARPDALLIADESSARPGLTREVEAGGLGFDLKWDERWGSEALTYLGRDPLHRKHHHAEVVVRMLYAFREGNVLALGREPTDRGAGPLYELLAGDPWQKRAHLRLLLGWLFAIPGKKHLFMGAETVSEGGSDGAAHQDALDRWLADLARAYRTEPALHELDVEVAGFEWVDTEDAERSVVTFLRKAGSCDDIVLVALNFTPVPRSNYRIGIPRGGRWREILNGDAKTYGGSGWGNMGMIDSAPVPANARARSLTVSLPPLAAVYFKHAGGTDS